MRRKFNLLVIVVFLAAVFLQSFSTAALEEESAIPSEWAQKEVGEAVQEGIISDSEIRNYQKNITRLEFSELIWKMICVKEGDAGESYRQDTDEKTGSVPDESTVKDRETGSKETLNTDNHPEESAADEESAEEQPFPDTDNDAVSHLYEAGIIKGMDDGLFYPDQLLTREQGASLIARTANYFGIHNPNGDVIRFYDGSDFGEWAVTDIKFVSAQKTSDGVRVMSGYDSRFSPKEYFTTEQAILSVYRLYGSLALGASEDTSWISQRGWRLTKVALSAAGDCTLGRDLNAAYSTSLDAVYDRSGGDPSIFFRNVTQFHNDDVTIVNFEGTLTDATVPAVKTFRFKGRKAYTEILRTGSIDVVNIANNHSQDYLAKGYADTVEALSEASIGVSGNEYTYIKAVNGVNIGFYGLAPMSSGLTQSYKDTINERIKTLRQQGAQYIVGSFHWGIERSYTANEKQKAIGHYAVEQGTDLILGHHPHVLQNTEVYNGAQIVYSLGNFCFGGNKNPADKDTVVFQNIMTFDLETGENISEDRIFYPYRLSSVTTKNDYQPVPVSGAEAERVLAKLG